MPRTPGWPFATERRRSGLARFERREVSRRGAVAAVTLAVAAAGIIAVDRHDAARLEPARRVMGEALGPVENGTADVVRPIAALPEWLQGQRSLRRDVAALERENAELRAHAETTGYDANRLATYDGLTKAADESGYAMVPAHVVAYGPTQTFSRTVTIDAGTDAGLTADLTVVNDDGLVGRVVRATKTTSTVLLAVDPDSVVGGRLGRSMEVGFARGQGGLGGPQANLSLELVDESVVPRKGDSVITWGSGRPGDDGPYVSGIPIGKVITVYASPRETSQRAVLRPYVDFGSLDLVGVVVPKDTRSDRELVEAGEGDGGSAESDAGAAE